MDDEEGRSHAIWVSHRQPDGQWNLISTGLRGYRDEDDDFIIPLQDEMTTVEMIRIIAGTIRTPSGTIIEE